MPGADIGVKIAPRPLQFIPKSIAHGALAAAIVTAKFVDALPLYRQGRIVARERIESSRQTMAGLLMQLHTPLQPAATARQDLLPHGRSSISMRPRNPRVREPENPRQTHVLD